MKLSKLSFSLISIMLAWVLSGQNQMVNGSESHQPLKSSESSKSQPISEAPSPRGVQQSQSDTKDNQRQHPPSKPPEPSIVIDKPGIPTQENTAINQSEDSFIEKAFAPSTLAGWGQTVVAALGLLVIWLTLRAIREQVEANKESVDIAKLSMEASQRAYLHFGGCRWISHPDNRDGHIFWAIRTRWVNSGNTPTRKLCFRIHFDLRSDELPADFGFTEDSQAPDVPALVYPKGEIIVGIFHINGDDLVAISQGKKHLYVWGCAKYRDVFPGTKEHITKVCLFARNITGDPMLPWDEKTNPVDIVFASYHRHNCADEDCVQ
ncbi:MAG: hypothetical protein HOP35_03155 [Nitrospira sp.]|nr:hypothetical protein [Nitrospira sp.]